MLPKLLVFCKIMYLLKATIFIVCFSIFVYLMMGVWNKFNTKSTTTITSLVDNYHHDFQLPCLTACPMKGFKKSGFFFTETDFLSNSYSANDLLNLNLSTFEFGNQLEIFEVRNHHLGRCFTICFKSQVSEDEIAYISFKRKQDLLGGLKFSVVCFLKFSSHIGVGCRGAQGNQQKKSKPDVP